MQYTRAVNHTTFELAQLARETLAQRLVHDSAGDWCFVTKTTAKPARIAALRATGMPTAEITAQYPELSAVDVKAARISSYLHAANPLASVERLDQPEHAELRQRLVELAALLHAGQPCCAGALQPA